MKNIIKYISIAILTLILGSCNLDQYPYSETAADQYVKDAAAVNNLVIGAYNGLYNVMYWEWALTEVRTDNARMRNNNSTAQDSKLIEQLDQGVITTAHDWVGSYWEAAYATIDRANKVIMNLEVVEDEAERNYYEAEARYLRAQMYFNLVRLWGPVFLVTTKTSGDVAREMQRAAVEEIYAQIEEDLNNIISGDKLPNVVDSKMLGRANMLAVKSLLAKVYMTAYEVGSDKYMKAGDLLAEVISLSGSPASSGELVPYADIFSITNEMNKEIIFSVRYRAGNIGLGSPFASLFAPLNNGGNVLIGSPKQYNYPSDDLISKYNANKTDLRKDVVLKEGYFNKTTAEWVVDRWCDKYLSPIVTEFDAENDWPVIRLADMLLLRAEWINETAGPNDEALNYLNMIRERAGIIPFTFAEVGTRYDFRVAVRDERRLELAFENQRWFDLLRWGIATTTVNNFLATEFFFSEYSYEVNPIADWQVMLPVPISVTNINPAVAQNPGY